MTTSINTEKLSSRVIIDNDTCNSATVVQVSSDRHGILFETIQVLTDLRLIITKAYISCDEGWFMDVFHVTNNEGDKIQDEQLLNRMHKALTADTLCFNFPKGAVEVVPNGGHSKIFLRGTDRQGLLSGLSELLTRHGCNIENTHLWTHKHHAAAVAYVTDEFTGCEIQDRKKVSRIKKDLLHLVKPPMKKKSPSPRSGPGHGGSDNVNTAIKEIKETPTAHCQSSRASVTVSNYEDRGYTLVVIRSNYRLKLLLDTVRTLIFKQYIVFHGTLTTGDMGSYQEYYIRHIDGCPINTKAEKQQLEEALEETINNPDFEGTELELCTDGQFRQLPDIVTVIEEKGCWIKRAQISMTDGIMKHTFFITDVSGKAVDPSTISLIQERIGQNMLRVKEKVCCSPMLLQRKTRSFQISNMLRRLKFPLNKFFKSNHVA